MLRKSNEDKQYKELGSTIRKMREDRNIGLREFADSLNVNPSHISQIETGKKKISDELLHKVAHQLNVPEEKLFSIIGRTPYSIILALSRRPDYQKLVALLERELENDDIMRILHTLNKVVEKQGALSKEDVNIFVDVMTEKYSLDGSEEGGNKIFE